MKMNKECFDKIKACLENEGLENTLNDCWMELNQLGLHREMQMYIYARDNLESAILRLYEVYDFPTKS